VSMLAVWAGAPVMLSRRVYPVREDAAAARGGLGHVEGRTSVGEVPAGCYGRVHREKGKPKTVAGGPGYCCGPVPRLKERGWRG
jgi:hypothetical protein